MYAALPSGADVSKFLVGAEVVTTAPPQADVDRWAASAKQELQDRTGWKPFLKDTADVTRSFDTPRGSVLELDAGLLTLTSITVGISSSSSGRVLTLDKDFALMDRAAAVEERPYDRIQFYCSVSGRIDVRGRWGFWSQIHDDVFDCVLKRAAALGVAELKKKRHNLSELKQDDVTYKFDLSKDQSADWNDDFYEMVGRRRRTVC